MPDFGGRLREARERRGKSLHQLSAATKIPVATLEALERNDISKLPGGIFTRAFIRSYAIEVGLDPGATLSEFFSAFASPPAERPAEAAASAPGTATLGRVPQGRPGPAAPSLEEARAFEAAAVPPEAVSEDIEFQSRQRMARAVLKLVLASLPIAVAILYFGSRAPRASLQPAQTAGAPEPLPAMEVPAPSVEALAPAALPPNTPAIESRAASTEMPPSEPVQTASLVGETDRVTIEVAPTAECWVQLTTDGTMALSRVLQPGERESRQFVGSARLRVGDAAACRFFLNGREARPLGRPRQARTITITPDNVLSLVR